MRSQIERLLSTRERDVLKHTLAGLRAEEISELLRLSKRTVEVHQASIKSKLGIRDKYELLRVAYRVGLFPYSNRGVDLAISDSRLDGFLMEIRDNVDCIRLDLSHGYQNVAWRINMAIEDLRKLEKRLHRTTNDEGNE